MWQDRPLVQAMKNGDLFLVDEISLVDNSVLERLNSVLEPRRKLVAMNPGGDYGKKELSPALQNRCTEIWVRPTNDLNELRTIGLQRTSEPGQSYVVDSMVNFWQWFNQLQIARTLTIRDLLSWLAFIDATEGNLPPEDALLHGAFLVLLDGISLGSSNKDQKLSIPPMVGTVWDACSALKKTPSTNITAIGRAITQVAVSMKDVLREMKELKPASAKPNDEDSEEASVKDDSGPHDSDDSCGGDLGNDFSPEEMKIAQLAIGVVSETLVVIKEIICFITSLNKQENPNNGNDFVNPLERFLKLCQESGLQVDKLGACLYPPRVFCYEDGRGKNIQHY